MLHPRFHNKNFDFVVKILLDNCYPLNLIFDVFNQRLKYLINKHEDISDKTQENASSFFTVPYLPSVTEQFRNIIKNTNIRLSFFSLNKLKKFIRAHKDNIPKKCKNNVVYKLNCSDCDASYVGQTSRMLKTRISEHRSQINRSVTNYSVITNYRLLFYHDFCWNDVEVLDEIPFHNKRLISEMLHIKRQRNGLNLQMDTDNLPALYHDIINKLPKI